MGPEGRTSATEQMDRYPTETEWRLDGGQGGGAADGGAGVLRRPSQWEMWDHGGHWQKGRFKSFISARTEFWGEMWLIWHIVFVLVDWSGWGVGVFFGFLVALVKMFIKVRRNKQHEFHSAIHVKLGGESSDSHTGSLAALKSQIAF